MGMPKPGIARASAAAAIPALFVLLPIGLIGWYALQHPATHAEVLAHRQNELLQAKIRRCSIGLDHDTCARAFYCASDPVECAKMVEAEPAGTDDRAAY